MSNINILKDCIHDDYFNNNIQYKKILDNLCDNNKILLNKINNINITVETDINKNINTIMNNNKSYNDIIYELNSNIKQIINDNKINEEKMEFYYNDIKKRYTEIIERQDNLENALIKVTNYIIDNNTIDETTIDSIIKNIEYLKTKINSIELHKITLEYHNKIEETIKKHSPLGVLLVQYLEDVKKLHKEHEIIN